MDVTIAEAVTILEPPIHPRQLRMLITALHIEQTGTRRHTGRPGRPHATYRYEDLSRLHAALAPWLTDCVS